MALVEIYFNNDTNYNYTDAFMNITGLDYWTFNQMMFDESSKMD